MDLKYRIIDTGLTGPIQKDILASIMGQLSDGYWENSPRMELYWRNAKVLERDGKVVLVIQKHAFPYYAMSDDLIKQWFAKKIKFIIKEEFGKSRDVWNRTNTKQKTDWLSHKSPSLTSVSDCYYAYDTLMGRNTANKKYSMESVYNKLMGKSVVTEGIMKRLLNKFREVFENWTPQNGKNLDREDGINDYGEPYYCWEQEVWVALNDEGKIYVEANGLGFVSEFELDEVEVAKLCIDQCLYDLGYGDVNFESVKPSKKKVVTEGAMKEIYTKFVEAFAYWVPSNQTTRGDLTEDTEGRPCVAFEDGRVVISLLEWGRKIKVCADLSQDYMRKYFNFDEVEAIKKYTESLIDYIRSDANNLEESKKVNTKKKVIKESEGYDSADELEPFESDYVPTDELIRKEAMAQLRFEDIPYSEAKMLANDIVATLCGQPFDSKSEFELYVSFEIRENLRAFYESKKVDKSKKVIKLSIEDWEVTEAIEQAVYNFDWDVEYDDVDVIAQLEIALSGKSFKDEYLAEQAATRYLKEHYRELAYLSVKPSKKRKVIKEGSFDNVHWDMDVTYPTLDQVIAILRKARKELGNVEVAVQYRDDGGEYSGYDNKIYFWFDKDTKTFVL